MKNIINKEKLFFLVIMIFYLFLSLHFDILRMKIKQKLVNDLDLFL